MWHIPAYRTDNSINWLSDPRGIINSAAQSEIQHRHLLLTSFRYNETSSVFGGSCLQNHTELTLLFQMKLIKSLYTDEKTHPSKQSGAHQRIPP